MHDLAYSAKLSDYEATGPSWTRVEEMECIHRTARARTENCLPTPQGQRNLICAQTLVKPEKLQTYIYVAPAKVFEKSIKWNEFQISRLSKHGKTREITTVYFREAFFVEFKDPDHSIYYILRETPMCFKRKATSRSSPISRSNLG